MAAIATMKKIFELNDAQRSHLISLIKSKTLKGAMIAKSITEKQYRAKDLAKVFEDAGMAPHQSKIYARQVIDFPPFSSGRGIKRRKYKPKTNETLTISEHDEQVAFFRWLKLASRKDDRLSLAFAIPNGGHRHIGVARKLKNEGVKSGVPDICIPVALNGYHGLWIEMKSAKGCSTPIQKQWLAALNEQGYLAVVCKGSEDAIVVVTKYFGLRYE